MNAQMTSRELKEFFREHLVPSDLYKIDGHRRRRICMERSGDGWDIFFGERHHRKVGLIHESDEASACRTMKNELRKLMESMYGVTWAM